MGLYAIGSECCNNCIHWDCHTERKFRGNPPKEVYTDSNCDKCDLTGRNTLSKDTCGMFKHIGGITRTFAAEKKHASGDYVGNILDSFDEGTRAYLQAIVDYKRDSGAVGERSRAGEARQSEAEQEEEEDNFDGEDELEFARTMEEYGRANERRRELLDEGLYPAANIDDSVEFMQMLDRARGGDAKAQYAFARALREGTHGGAGGEFLYRTYKMGLVEKWCMKAAKQGLAEAQYDIGHRYADGGCSTNYEIARGWLTKAAEQGHAKAKTELCNLKDKLTGEASGHLNQCIRLLVGAECGVDEAKAIDCIRNASNSLEVSMCEYDEPFVVRFLAVVEKIASGGMLELQNAIGKMYGGYSSFENIIQKDMGRAVYWFELAARGGCLDAMDNLGNCYANGKGVEQNESQAVKWYRKAAEGGLDWGQYHYACKLLSGEGVEKDAALGKEWMQKAADQGVQKAKEKIEALDAPRKVEEYQKAAKLGDVNGMYMLGECYNLGRGVDRDLNESVKWFRAAAMQGHIGAMDGLGRCYEYGEGVDADEELSAAWYFRAAKAGLPWGQFHYANVLENGKGAIEDEELAVAWYLKAAKQGLADAQWRLGCRIVNGRGTEKDEELGESWTERAKVNGYEPPRSSSGW